MANPPSLIHTLSDIHLNDFAFEKDILAEQIAMTLSWTWRIQDYFFVVRSPISFHIPQLKHASLRRAKAKSAATPEAAASGKGRGRGRGKGAKGSGKGAKSSGKGKRANPASSSQPARGTKKPDDPKPKGKGKAKAKSTKKPKETVQMVGANGFMQRFWVLFVYFDFILERPRNLYSVPIQ